MNTKNVNGRQLLTKEDGSLLAYGNRTQAQKRCDAIGDGARVFQAISPARGFYVEIPEPEPTEPFFVSPDAPFVATLGGIPAAYTAALIARAERRGSRFGVIVRKPQSIVLRLSLEQHPAPIPLSVKGLMRRARRFVATLPAGSRA